MYVCTVAIGRTAFTEFGSPLSPSHTTKNTSATPRFLRSVRTAIQNFADSPSPSPAHIPRMSLCGGVIVDLSNFSDVGKIISVANGAWLHSCLGVAGYLVPVVVAIGSVMV